MYLFPTKDEMDALWREISPRERCLRAMRQAVSHACTVDSDSMAAFFLESDDVSLREEEGELVYHIDPPKYLESPKDICPVTFKGWDFVVPASYRPQDEYEGIYLGEKMKWEDI